MGNQSTEPQKSFRRTLLLPTLFLCVFLAFSVTWFLGTLLINVSASFNVPIGTASQLVTIGYVTGLIMGFAMSAFAIRFKHKSLFVFGVALFAVAVLIWFFAPNFATAILAQVLVGASFSTISIMAYTLIGEQLPLERRGWATGLVAAAIMTSSLVLGVVSGVIASVAGWRMVPLGFIFPISIVCLFLALLVVPSKQPQPRSEAKPSFVQALKKILTRVSPIACTVSAAMVSFSMVFPIFAVSFLRITFSLSPTYAGLCMTMAAALGIVGGVVGGRAVNRIGRKPLTITAVLFVGLSAFLFTFMPAAAFSIMAWGVNAFAAGVIIASLPSLTLEQVPEYRGSMMSIYSSFDSAGMITGLIIGGLVLNLFANSFHMLYIIFGLVGVSTAAVVFFFAKDPCRPGSTP
jgi:predicted MFS family arabinose efflux permease